MEHLTVGQLRQELANYPDDAQVVVTVKDDLSGISSDDPATFYARPEVGHGWRPSNVVELTLGEFATG
jgi:hypothetical protein